MSYVRVDKLYALVYIYLFIIFLGLHPVASIATDFLWFRQSQLILFNVLYFILITYSHVIGIKYNTLKKSQLRLTEP
jgi:hypothetical protein